jgi:hypothetical protein
MARNKKRLDLTALAVRAGEEIRTSQVIDYTKLRTTLGNLTLAQLQKVLARVDKEGITGFVGKRRKVIVNVDGTRKDGIVTNPKPRKRYRKRMKRAAPSASPAARKANGSYSIPEKKAVLDRLSGVVNAETALVLRSIRNDLDKVALADRIESAINKK